MTKDEAWEKYSAAKTRLVDCIVETYGRELNVFLPQIIKFLISGKRLIQPAMALRHLLSLTNQNGVPVFLGYPYVIHASDQLLRHLIYVEGWLPDAIPPLPSSNSGGTTDVTDCVARVREAAVYTTPVTVSDDRQMQNLPMADLRDTTR